MKYVNVGAVVVTVIWVVAVGCLVFFKRTEFATMAPNAWGDFLAGTVSPLALIWLVAGYLQQGRELKQNTAALHLQQKALMLQHKELAEQVKATLKVAVHSEQQATASAAMAELTRQEWDARQYEAVQADQPKIVFKFVYESGNGAHIYDVTNVGQPAYDLEMTCSACEDWTCSFGHEFLTENMTQAVFDEFNNGEEKVDFMVGISYLDINGKHRGQTYNIKNGISYLVSSTYDNQFKVTLVNKKF